jgi:hypothetical protein
VQQQQVCVTQAIAQSLDGVPCWKSGLGQRVQPLRCVRDEEIGSEAERNKTEQQHDGSGGGLSDDRQVPAPAEHEKGNPALGEIRTVRGKAIDKRQPPRNSRPFARHSLISTQSSLLLDLAICSRPSHDRDAQPLRTIPESEICHLYPSDRSNSCRRGQYWRHGQRTLFRRAYR